MNEHNLIPAEPGNQRRKGKTGPYGERAATVLRRLMAIEVDTVDPTDGLKKKCPWGK